MGRTRSKKNKGLPKYLYANGDAFIYKRPDMKAMGFGVDRAAAIRAAEEINRQLETPAAAALIERFNSQSSAPSSPPRTGQVQPGRLLFEEVAEAWLNHYIEEKRPKKSTLDATRQRKNRVCKVLGERPIEQVTTADCAALLADHTRSEYPKIRTVLIGVFTYAKEQGWFPSQQPNPAAETGTRRPKDKDRLRMTWAQYQGIYAHASRPVQMAMIICMQTTLRRSDLVSLRLDDIDPAFFLRDNRLHVIPHKSNTNRRRLGPSRLCWDLAKHPDLATLVREARESSLKHARCPFLLHEKPKRINQKTRDAKEHVAQILPGRMSRLFKEARDAAIEADPNLFKGYTPEQMPGLHEIRSLASFLYEKQGFDVDKVQELMAHTDEKMTQEYQEGHEVSWVEIDLKLAL